MSTGDLPIQLGLRTFLDSVSYSNVLPHWNDYLSVDYPAVVDRISRKIHGYLAAGRQVAQPFTIRVPQKPGKDVLWVLPALNDQIILQVCVSQVAPAVHGLMDQERVFSYGRPAEPSTLALYRDQLDSWIRFQLATDERLRQARYLLQIDLESAFARIDRSDFVSFLRELGASGRALELLSLLLGAVGGPNGLPLVNDGLSFLGNGFLSRVDRLIEAIHPDFVRFVDDYRLFGSSRQQLERVFEEVNRALTASGFHINEQKVRLGSAADYYRATGRLIFANSNPPRLEGSDYLAAPILKEVVSPSELLELIRRAVAEPEKQITVGLGRLLLGSLRKLRIDAAVPGSNFSPLMKFWELFAKDEPLQARVRHLLLQYGTDPGAEWRTVWLLYLMESAIPSVRSWDRAMGGDLRATVEAVANRQGASTLVRLWCRKLLRQDYAVVPGGSTFLFETHEVNYLEEGRMLLSEARP